MPNWERLTPPTDWTSPPILWIQVADRQVIVDRFGPPHTSDVMAHMGAFDAWLVRFPCGLEANITWFRGHSSIEPGIEIYANAHAPGHLLFHLDLPAIRHGLSRPTDEPETTPWRVMRQDDNGNVAIAHRVSSECEARGLAVELEARGHKQMYWVERD